MSEVLNKSFLLGCSITALILLAVVYIISEKTKDARAGSIAISKEAAFRHKIFGSLATVSMIGLALEIGTIVLGFLGQDNSTLTILEFIPRLYLLFFLVWVSIFSYYVLSISLKRSTFSKLRNKPLAKICAVALLLILFLVCMFLPLDLVNDGVFYHGAGLLVDGVIVPIILVCEIFWIIVVLRQRKHLSSKFAPVVAVVILLVLAILVRLLDNRILIFGLVFAVVITIGLLTIDNKNKLLFEAEARARMAEVRANKVKDEFMSLASHQLRTPLTSIQGYASMLAEGDFGELNKEQRHALSEVAGSASRMSFLVSDLLNISRLQSGKFLIERVDTNMGDLIEKEVEALRILAESHGVILEYNKKSSGVPNIMADKKKIGEVLANMIDNAIFYSPAGKKVKISLKKEGNFVEVRVKDSGIGVPEKEQGSLFTKFYRATNARTKRPDGTGIGLYLARRIITEQGGEMIFESIEGKGSTFGFRLPIDRNLK